MHDPENPGSLTLINAVADEFQKQWRNGDNPRIEAFLLRNKNIDDKELALALVAREVHLRDLAGDAPNADEYRERFPEHGEVVSEVFSDTMHSADDDTSHPIEEIPGLQRLQFDSDAKQIGRYEIVEELGKGGFATVYLGVDKLAGRRVAIKVASGSHFTTQKVSRNQLWSMMLSEVQAASGFSRNSGIVDIHDIILFETPDMSHSTDDPVCAIVMDYIDGGTLADELRRERPSRKRTLQVVLALAEALIEPHEREIWHRDLKPQNILIDDQRRPIITDFGLAINDEHQRISENAKAGTLGYMSPEQLSGTIIDARSDIWSLGVIMYEMLTGKRPFTGRDSFELEERIKFRDPKPPSILDSSVPVELEEVCLRCLAKQPSMRYASSVRLRDAISVASGIGTPSVQPATVVDDEPKNSAEPVPPKPVKAIPKSLVPWIELDEADRAATTRMLKYLANRDLTNLQNATLQPVSSCPLARAVRQFCRRLIDVKMDISADNRASVFRGLERCLMALSGRGVYESYAETLRPSVIDVVHMLYASARSKETKEDVHRCVRIFATDLADDALIRQLPKP